jgi:hypothetical protein
MVSINQFVYPNVFCPLEVLQKMHVTPVAHLSTKSAHCPVYLNIQEKLANPIEKQSMGCQKHVGSSYGARVKHESPWDHSHKQSNSISATNLY